MTTLHLIEILAMAYFLLSVSAAVGLAMREFNGMAWMMLCSAAGWAGIVILMSTLTA